MQELMEWNRSFKIQS